MTEGPTRNSDAEPPNPPPSRRKPREYEIGGTHGDTDLGAMLRQSDERAAGEEAEKARRAAAPVPPVEKAPNPGKPAPVPPPPRIRVSAHAEQVFQAPPPRPNADKDGLPIPPLDDAPIMGKPAWKPPPRDRSLRLEPPPIVAATTKNQDDSQWQFLGALAVPFFLGVLFWAFPDAGAFVKDSILTAAIGALAWALVTCPYIKRRSARVLLATAFFVVANPVAWWKVDQQHRARVLVETAVQAKSMRIVSQEAIYATSPSGRPQIGVRLQIANDGDDADYRMYTAEKIRATENNEGKVTTLMAMAAALRRAEAGISMPLFRLRHGESRVFYTEVANLTEEQKREFTDGLLTYYFVGRMIVTTTQGTRPFPFCGGNLQRREFLFDCPVTVMEALTHD